MVVMYTKPKKPAAAASAPTAAAPAATAPAAAMAAAFMNPDRAVQYLEEGLPDAGGDDAMEDEGDDAGPTPTTWPELVNNRQFQREIGAITDQGSLQAYLGQLASADPQKLSLIQANPQAFSQLLNAAAAARAGGGGGG